MKPISYEFFQHTFQLIFMDRRALILIYFFSSSIYLVSAMAAANAFLSNKTDKAALLAFKIQITNDPSGALLSWNDSTYFCNWEGVFCSKKNKGRVVSIDLSSRGISGYISSSIDNLTFLHDLDLSQNQFSGIIPPTLFRLPRLRFLELSLNYLHGEIPSNLSSSLTILDLSGNYISGTIPSSLGHLPKLSVVSLYNNSLTGKIPPSLGNLSSLQVLDLFRNQLDGSMPEEIGNHQSLKVLHVSTNKLSGELPTSIFNLSSAYFFGVSVNNFEGMIPTTFGNNLPNLRTLLMGLNQFKGTIPASLTNASKFYNIDMSGNNFNGIIPSSLGRLRGLSILNLELNQLEASDHNSWRFFDALTNCSQLKILSLVNNKLSGTLPKSTVNLSTNIQELRIHMNQISGIIPSGIGNLINLTVLAIGSNLLTGAIPESIGKLARLRFLTLNQNMLTGTLTSSIGNLTQMEYLYLADNGFKGPIPPSIRNLKSLVVLTIHNNNLNGSLPKEVFKLPSILILSLSNNSLTGHIPLEIGGLKYVTRLYFYENKLSGEIPGSISGCVSLEVLDLSSNLIQGTIPPSMGDLKSLTMLDLSENNLSGQIPKALGTLRSLENLNFSFNHLAGEVPREGIFLNATGASLQGNYGLCGGVSDLHLPTCPHISSYEKRRHPRLLLLAILLPTMVVCLILFFILCFICKRKNLIKNSSNPKIMEDVYPKVSYAELVKATDGFSPTNLLGIGQYGSVYKGLLNNYGYTTVAVKVFNLQQQGASKAFVAECEALKHIRHRNLVKILTCCVGIDSKGNDFMAIVFEFMPNGNLDTWLHAENNMMEHLDLIKRLDIALNIANALCYLHHDCETPIIHCDLKPSNVLLDDDMVAHVGDFGLARLLLNGVVSNRLVDSDHSSPLIRGTIGYAAPEYGLGGQVSTMGDVYSFGILLLELFTGRRPVDEIFQGGLNLHKFVEMSTPNRIMEVIDPILQLQFKDEAKNDIQSRTATYECLISILQLSISCSKELARERINMADATVELHSIRDVYFEAGFQCNKSQNKDQ